MKYEILALEGTDGMIPNEGIEYAVKSGRIIVKKNGETVIDDEYKTGPSVKYILDGDELPLKLHNDEQDEEEIKLAEEKFFNFGKKKEDPLSSAKNNAVNSLRGISSDIDEERIKREEIRKKLLAAKSGVAKEYNVANMLPQGMGANAGLAEEDLAPDIKVSEATNIDNARKELKKIKIPEDWTLISKDRAEKESEVAKYDFEKKNLVPIAFTGDNDYLCFDTKKKEYCMVNIVDNVIFNRNKDITTYLSESTELLEASGDYVKTMITSFGKAMKKEWDKVPKNEKKLKELKTRLVNFCDKNHVTPPETGIYGLVAASCDDTIPSADTLLESISFDKEIIEYVLNDEQISLEFVSESLDDTIRNMKTKINVSQKIRGLVVSIAILKAKLKILSFDKEKNKLKINDIKKEIIQKEKEKREITKSSSSEEKSDISKLEKEAQKNAEKEVEKEIKESNLHYEIKKDEEVVKESTSVIEENEEIKEEEKESPSLIDSYCESFMENNDRIRELENDHDNYHGSLINALISENALTLHKINYLLFEAANIEGEIKPIIDKLNSMGYKTKYSSPGHIKLRKKEDKFRDGNYYGKLYSDARIMFDGRYNFPSAPKYWMWKKVDGNDYLDIVPIDYNEKDGTPDEAFKKWKDAYMQSLKNFVDTLKPANSAKGDDNGPKDTHKEDDVKEEIDKKEEVKKESTQEMLDNMINLF